MAEYLLLDIVIMDPRLIRWVQVVGLPLRAAGPFTVVLAWCIALPLMVVVVITLPSRALSGQRACTHISLIGLSPSNL